MAQDRSHIHRDIADGEVFRHDGPVTLHGNVGKGAYVDIANGGIKIKGDVGDSAGIRTRGSGDFLGGITVTGRTGSHVTLDSDLGIRMNDAGAQVRIRSGDIVNFSHVGPLFNVNAADTISGGNMGPNARLRSKGSCTLGGAGEGSIVDSAGLVQMTFVGHDCRISCDFFDAASLGADSVVDAREQAMVGAAHASAQITSKSVHIRERVRK